MPAQIFSFRGPTFFQDVRARMDADRGLFFGADGDLRFVVMDATFYRMEVFVRPAGVTFTDGASGLMAREPDIRALCNGQFIAHYSYAVPSAVQGFEGEIIVDHLGRRFEPPKPLDFHTPHIGQWDGRSEFAFDVERGAPSNIVPRYRSAMGKLIPAMENGVRAGIMDLFDPTGRRTQRESAGISWWIVQPVSKGKAIAGIHRGTQSLFILLQRHKGPGGGVAMQGLITRFRDMGVDDAVVLDGSDSVALLVDGAADLMPQIYKNNSITTGLMFRLQQLRIGEGSELVVRPPSGNPLFAPAMELSPVEGRVELVANGARLRLTSLGRSSADFAPGGRATAAAGSTNASIPAGTVLTETRGLIAFPVAFGFVVTTRVTLTSLGLRESAVGGAGWMSSGAASTDPAFPPNARVSDPAGTFRISAENGGELEITSLGAREAIDALPAINAAQTAALLHVTLPLRLTSSSPAPSLRAGGHYVGPDAMADLQVQFAGTPNVALVGVLTITTVLGVASFAIQWPLSVTPYAELEVAAQLGVPLPVTLQSLATDLTHVVDFNGEGALAADIQAHLDVNILPAPTGSLRGTLVLNRPEGQVTLNVVWPLASAIPDNAGTAAALRVNLPLELTSPLSNLAVSAPFSGPAGSNVTADLRLQGARDNDGVISGTLRIAGAQPVEFDVNWPLRT